MNLTLEGLYELNNNKINFRIGKKIKKAFYIKIDESIDGDLSFFFDFT